jgi:hypothetical protein
MFVLIDWINNVLLFDDFSRRHRAIRADLSLLPGFARPVAANHATGLRRSD